MKTASLSVILVVVIFAVAEIYADCDSNCNHRCYYRGCKAYASALNNGTCYCCCVDCGSDSFFKIGHVNENTHRQQFTDELLMEIKNYRR
uniref:Mytilin 3 n=1 Tax=Perna viridis TaxID=73031 RepID=A0A6B9XKT1_PERVI|nr:mytilin 3 [Perna viridis]QVN25583.1 pernalin D [Perna viridis]